MMKLGRCADTTAKGGIHVNGNDDIANIQFGQQSETIQTLLAFRLQQCTNDHMLCTKYLPLPFNVLKKQLAMYFHLKDKGYTRGAFHHCVRSMTIGVWLIGLLVQAQLLCDRKRNI